MLASLQLVFTSGKNYASENQTELKNYIIVRTKFSYLTFILTTLYFLVLPSPHLRKIKKFINQNELSNLLLF